MMDVATIRSLLGTARVKALALSGAALITAVLAIPTMQEPATTSALGSPW